MVTNQGQCPYFVHLELQMVSKRRKGEVYGSSGSCRLDTGWCMAYNMGYITPQKGYSTLWGFMSRGIYSASEGVVGISEEIDSSARMTYDSSGRGLWTLRALQSTSVITNSQGAV